MIYDQRVEQRAREVVDGVQRAHHIHLNDQARGVIFEKVRETAAYWKNDHFNHVAANYHKKFNELKLWNYREKPMGWERFNAAIVYVDAGNTLRGSELANKSIEQALIDCGWPPGLLNDITMLERVI
ncbi:hypothetical protein H4O14_02245 [Bacillus sp. PAMC26568]|nr:hypothetical protein H4O14_02245 [Bacillus sp. PAMC26568]